MFGTSLVIGECYEYHGYDVVQLFDGPAMTSKTLGSISPGELFLLIDKVEIHLGTIWLKILAGGEALGWFKSQSQGYFSVVELGCFAP